MAKSALGLQGKVPKKFFASKILDFYIIQFLFLFMVLYDVIFNATVPIWMKSLWFFSS
jgi:hypothetical protein